MNSLEVGTTFDRSWIDTDEKLVFTLMHYEEKRWSVNRRHALYSASEIDLWKYSKILCFWYDLMLGKQAYEQI